MRRRHVHLAFALASAGCVAVALRAWLALERAERVNLAIVAAAPAADDPAPEVRLAHALRLAGADDYDGALQAYKALVRAEAGPLRRAALYDLGNLHMREARRHADKPDAALPFIELAKQNYRDLLREDPGDWDARYNLERALWLAPEIEQPEVEGLDPLDSERAITTMRGGKGVLP